MFLLVGCQTTQSAETETVPEVVKEGKELPKEEVTKPHNPFENLEIPPGQIITSTKPVVCGRIDVMLNRMKEQYGEVPVFIGRVAIQNSGEGQKQIVSMLVQNQKTGSYTFLEQMPVEERLMCILSTGHGKLKISPLGTKL